MRGSSSWEPANRWGAELPAECHSASEQRRLRYRRRSGDGGSRHDASSLATEFTRGDTSVPMITFGSAGARSARNCSACDSAFDDGTKSHSSAAAAGRITGMRSCTGRDDVVRGCREDRERPLPSAGRRIAPRFVQAGEVQQAAARIVEPDRSPCGLRARPLEEAVGRDDAAPAHEGIAEGRALHRGFGPRVDLLECALRVGRPAVDEAPLRRQELPLLLLRPQDPVLVRRRDVVARAIARGIIRRDDPPSSSASAPKSLVVRVNLPHTKAW